MPDPEPLSAGHLLGDADGFRLLTGLVSIAPTNLEDPAHGRWEKPNYPRAAELIARTARGFGLATRVFDPLVSGRHPEALRGIPRPNVLIDLDVGARRTLLILAHFDVVPVPVEQAQRWKSSPHTLTHRSDGRLYGRGANDDLGSGVVASLIALRRLADGGSPRWNIRLIAACDEETGGEGGIEAIRQHDEDLRASDGDRFLAADAALIPDGSPEVTAGSSGLAFLQGSFAKPTPARGAVAYGQDLVALHTLARTFRSVYASPDWPDHGAPDPVLTGRATLTQLDVEASGPRGKATRLLQAHAETDAGNQIPQAVTLVFQGSPSALTRLATELAPFVAPPFVLGPAGATSVTEPKGALALQVVGRAAHGGYPHRGHNPVPVALGLLEVASERGWIDASAPVTATYTVDYRMIPEMELASGVSAALGHVRASAAKNAPGAKLEAPPARSRPGYALPPDHPMADRLQRIMTETFGSASIVGEYGGTDASALRGLTTPSGDPLPALVFGSMDRAANIHDAEESVDPRLLRSVAETIVRFVCDAD